jgi:hypothetical protein
VREREGEIEIDREREKEREREGSRARDMVIEFISLLLIIVAFLFSKGMMGAVAPFSYLVYKIYKYIVSDI